MRRGSSGPELDKDPLLTQEEALAVEGTTSSEDPPDAPAVDGVTRVQDPADTLAVDGPTTLEDPLHTLFSLEGPPQGTTAAEDSPTLLVTLSLWLLPLLVLLPTSTHTQPS